MAAERGPVSFTTGPRQHECPLRGHKRKCLSKIALSALHLKAGIAPFMSTPLGYFGRVLEAREARTARADLIRRSRVCRHCLAGAAAALIRRR
jgi:hypothetical protein